MQGLARARATAALDADVLIVLRGDEEPDPALVERVCTAFAAGDADVLALVCRDPDAERDTGVPVHLRRTDASADLRAFVPVGGPAVAAVAYPALSVGPYAIRRAALEALGGYARDTWGEACDRDLLARAALAGLRIDVLPEPLATSVRDDRWSAMRARYWGDAAVPLAAGEEQLRVLRPFRRRLDDDLGDLPALLVGALRATATAADERAVHAEQRQELVDAYEHRIREFNELVATYERHVGEQRELIARYERERMRALRAAGRARWIAGRLRQGLRPPASAWPGRGLRFAHRRAARLRRRRER
jgi:hypothetical protein